MSQTTQMTSLIVDGGGMRGIFAAGVLDAFLRRGYDPFDMYVGVSSGVLNLGSYLARQPERNYRIFTQIATQPEFMNVWRFLRGGHFMDLDWLWAQSVREPLDLDTAVSRLRQQKRQFIMVATDVDTGQPLYLHPTAENWRLYAKASAAVPVLYRNFVRLDGRALADGGVSDPLPVLETYRRGARHLVVIRTRPLDCHTPQEWSFRLAGRVFWRYPRFQQAFQAQYEHYRTAVAFLNAPPPGVTVQQIAPPQHLHANRSTRDTAVLQEDYALGYQMGLVGLDSAQI